MRQNVWAWIAAAVLIAAGVTYSMTQSAPSPAEQAAFAALFHVPPEAAFTTFRSTYSRGRLREYAGVVQFTPEQWEGYLQVVDDEARWDPRGFVFGGTSVTGEPVADAMRWHEGEYAWINGEFAAFWLNWSHALGPGQDGKPGVEYVRAARSYCWAVLVEGEAQRVISCREHKHSPEGLRFYARAKLDAEHQRLFAVVR